MSKKKINYLIQRPSSYLCSKVDTKPNTSLNFVIDPWRCLVDGVCLFESGMDWIGLAHKVSHQTWAAAAVENVNLFVCYTQWYEFWGEFPGRDYWVHLPSGPFQLAFKKLQLSNVLFNFLKNLKRWWCSHSWTPRPSKELWMGSNLRRRRPDEK